MEKQLSDNVNMKIQGHIRILDPDSGEVIVNKRNAINYENASEIIAQLLGGLSEAGTGFGFQINDLAYGNGGTVVDGLGTITYKTPNVSLASDQLYNETYSKFVANDVTTDPENNITTVHQPGTQYTDIVITSTLNYGEPVGQDALDNASTFDGAYVFDELGLKSQTGTFLSHVIFHPVQKAANRKMQVIYTIRIGVGS